MAREDTRPFVKALEAYESKPQTQIDDKVNPFRGAKPAQAATPAAVAAVAAGQVDATPGGAPQQAATDLASEDTPLVDEEGTLGDSSETSEGTSDETSASSTDSVDSGDEADPNSDLTGEEPAPKKGSARERIVEVLDLAEGYKEYGKLKENENRELRARLAQLTGNRTAPAAAAAPPPPPEVDEPMPDMSDEDVAFDNDKYRAKMTKWSTSLAERAARRAVATANSTNATAAVRANVEGKITTFVKDNGIKDWKEVVSENPVLGANQLGPDAGALVAESEYTAELLYRFGKDDELATRIARLPPRQQCKLIGDLEREIRDDKEAAKSKTKGTPQPGAKPGAQKSITQAPPPPRATVGGGRAAPRDQLDPGMGMEEFARQHRSNKQNARAANRRARGLN